MSESKTTGEPCPEKSDLSDQVQTDKDQSDLARDETETETEEVEGKESETLSKEPVKVTPPPPSPTPQEIAAREKEEKRLREIYLKNVEVLLEIVHMIFYSGLLKH